MEDVLDVCCLVFPDGRTYWFETKGNEGHVEQAIFSWKAGLSPEKRNAYEAAGVSCGAVFVRMLRGDFQQIPATNWSAEIESAIREAVSGGRE